MIQNLKKNSQEILEEDAVTRVGKGWESLIRRVYASIREVAPYVKVITVKEKLGGLRIYPSVYDDLLQPHITSACVESLSICEVCGDTGTMRKMDGLYATRCDPHSNGYPTIPDPLGQMRNY